MLKMFSEYLAEEENKTSTGTYSSLVLSDLSKSKLKTWVTKHHISNAASAETYHCTINYSRKEVPAIEKLTPNLPIKANIKGWDLLGPNNEKNVLVLLLDCPDAEQLFEDTTKLGAISDYPEFIAHITIAAPYSSELPKAYPKFTLVFNEFKVEELDLEKRAVDTKKD